MKLMNITGITILGFIILALVLIIFYLYYGITQSPNMIGILDIKITDNITLSGSFGDSTSAYKGYSTQYNNNRLYIKIRGSLSPGFIPFLSRSGDFIISIPNKFGGIKEVYLQGDNPSENVLIWPKK